MPIKGKFDLVLVTDLDRIGRNLRDFLNIWEIFKENNIKFIAINQNIDTSTITGEALIQQLMVFAELESKMNKQRASQKREFEVTKKGKWYGGTVPLGFDYEQKRLLPNEKEAEVVNLAFDLYLEKKSLGAVAMELNQRGFRTKKGKLFSKESVRTILKNPLYVGMVLYKDKAYRSEHQGIVEKEKWQEVQNLLGENHKERGRIEKDRHQYLLKGLVRCADCGSFMSPKSAKSGQYFYYSCTFNNRFGREHCLIRRVSAPELEKIVVSGIREVRRKEDLLDEMIERANQVSKDEISPLEKEKQAKEKELEEIKETIKRFLKSLKDGTKTLKLIEDELEELESRQEELEREINLLSIRIEEKRRYAVDGEILKNHLQEFDLIFDHLTPLDKQRLLHILLREIVFSGNRIKISLWDLPRTGLSLQETLTTNWFANSQIWLPGDGTGRTHFDFYIILKYRLILDKGLQRGKKIDLSQIKFALA
jgi:site-specific DNA recombinase